MAHRWGAPRYVAYVLRRSGRIGWADLGEAREIEAAVSEHLPGLYRGPARAQAAARALDELLMRPIRRLLGETRRVLLSPDGAFHVVPFASLRDEDGYRLAERYDFTHLRSGRDLVHRRGAAQPMLGATGDAPDASGGALMRP
jgi:hypothetical protein